MNPPKVCIYAPVDVSGASHRQLVEAGCEVVVGEPGASRAEVLNMARGSAALMGATFHRGLIDDEFFAWCPGLRIVSKYGIGVDDVDVERASELGLLVTHCPTESNWGGVAEGTMAFILTLLKRVRERDRRVKGGGWRDPDLRGTYLGARQDGYPGITVGIIGLGRTGARLADLLAPWRVRLLAYDPYVEEARFVHHGVLSVDLATLLRESDVVSVHCNLTAETRGLIGAEALGLMKATAVLVNTARGAIVDLDALCDALEAGKLAAAALDVLPEEPPPEHARVLGLGDRVLLCPHMVSANAVSPLQAAAAWATDALVAALRGEVPSRVYNVEAIPKWEARFAGKALVR